MLRTAAVGQLRSPDMQGYVVLSIGQHPRLARRFTGPTDAGPGTVCGA
ncbi:hypothetical protein STVIR_1912 [Streptomyces viridochromogenes Tue57]|uniref:Uncharacterized protein n=1 Tax=Streptomyces viridochromogenes Tue57 TaxID=1160705 RepID=L8PNL7_STRVR|nr:hypothetical protein STVIR_1912 [Streptomyces viridochromogenes Tue57]